MNDYAPMNRREVARETLAILETGEYRLAGGRTVSVRAGLDSARVRSVLYDPGDYEAILAQVESLQPHSETAIVVSDRTTLAAAHALSGDYPGVVALNFASATHPGGGFLFGADAQEESLARASGLYATLLQQPQFYAYHHAHRSALYSDHVIFSPGVPVFRDEADHLIDTPWRTSFITAAAVNVGALRQNNETEHFRLIEPTMERRVRMVLGVAAINHCEAIVLGAWGCGAFRNDPATIAAIFARVLAEPLFEKRFRHVEFAIYDRSRGRTTLAAFTTALSKGGRPSLPGA